MSGQHTKGRLVVRNLWLVPEVHSDRLIGGSSDPERDFDDYAHHIGSAEGKRNYHNNDANARRLAACWNAFDGVPTDKIEGKTVAEYVSNEVYLTGMTTTGGLNIGMSGLACQIMADAFAGQFIGSGAINFLEVGFTHPETGDLLVTMQRVEGETPAQQKAEALRKLAAARALLQEEMKAHEDNNRFESAARIRSFLEGK